MFEFEEILFRLSQPCKMKISLILEKTGDEQRKRYEKVYFLNTEKKATTI